MASAWFEPPSRNLFFKNSRSDDPRLGEFVMPISEARLANEKPCFLLYGHPSDEGIRANHGRSGAKDAPDAIRSAFYRMTPGCKHFPKLFDLGNFDKSGPLAKNQSEESILLAKLFKSGHKLISLGGGHDHGYPDISAFLKTYRKQKPLVINFDSHLDVRPSKLGPNSGSAFYQLFEEFGFFELIEAGIQPFCNSISHIEYAESKNAKIIYLNECSTKLIKLLNALTKKPRPTFISLDIDAFSSAYAPGASAVYPTGLTPNEFFSYFAVLLKRCNVRGLGIYEVSPPLDQDQRTTKLAATIIHNYLLTAKSAK